MILYSLRSNGEDFKITKFDHDGNIESSYLTDGSTCECPGFTSRQRCRHIEMFPIMLPSADTDRLYCYGDGKWYNLKGERLDD